MRRSMIRSLGLFVAMIATSLLLATVAQAGPPLICHTIEIGQAKSLPWIGQNLPHMTDGMRMDANPAAGVDGYALVKKAVALRSAALHGDDPQMEFAAALITLSGPQAEHREYAQKAIAGAKTDSLLAQNLATRFLGPQTETMSQLLAKN